MSKSHFMAMFCAVISFIFHVLTASLDTMLVASTQLDHDGIIDYHQECKTGTGLFKAYIVSGKNCPITSSGRPLADVICDNHDSDYSDEKAASDCQKVRASQAFVIIACILSFAVAAILLLTRDGGRIWKSAAPLSFLCALLEMSILIMFEDRSHDPEDGWASSYGCHYGEVKVISSSGETCLYRGSEYGFMISSMILSTIVSFLVCVVDKRTELQETERYDGSIYSSAPLLLGSPI